MKIISITLYQKDLPLSDPYWLSGRRLKFEVLDATFVKIETDNGFIGWGEGTPWGHTYVPAHGPGVRAGIETIAPVLMGMDPRHNERIEYAMDKQLPGHPYAKSPIDMACLDIAGQAAGLSLPDLMGGCCGTGTRIMSSVSSGAPDYMLAIIEKYREMGYRGHSVKVGGSDIELDIQRIRYIEQNRLEGERILYDVNRAWTRREASIVMNAVAELGVTFEQPCETTDDIKALRAVSTSPISVDETLISLNDMVRIAYEGIADVAGIKINRVGGLTKAKRIRDVAIAHGIQIYVMATGGSVLADTEAAALAQTIPDEFRLGCWACQDMLAVDIAPGRGPRSQHGELKVPGVPGLGFAPDASMLGKPVAVYGLQESGSQAR